MPTPTGQMLEIIAQQVRDGFARLDARLDGLDARVVGLEKTVARLETSINGKKSNDWRVWITWLLIAGVALAGGAGLGYVIEALAKLAGG